MDVTGARRSNQLGELEPRDAHMPRQLTDATFESTPPNFTPCRPVAANCDVTNPSPLTGVADQDVHPARAAKKVLAQSAMLRTIVRFLSVGELVAFSRTARIHGQAVAAELGHRSACLDAQYTELFDQYGSLNVRFAALLPVGGSTVDQLRAIRGRVKALGVEMDDKLREWDEIQHAWASAGIAEPRPVLTREECYLG